MQMRVVVSVVVEKDGKIIMGRKRKDALPYPNRWHLPGGGLDIAETLEEGAHREVREETGIEITNLQPFPFDEDFTKGPEGEIIHYIFLVYHAQYLSGDFVSKSDIEVVEWIDKMDLQKLSDEEKITPPSIKLFHIIGWIH